MTKTPAQGGRSPIRKTLAVACAFPDAVYLGVRGAREGCALAGTRAGTALAGRARHDRTDFRFHVNSAANRLLNPHDHGPGSAAAGAGPGSGVGAGQRGRRGSPEGTGARGRAKRWWAPARYPRKFCGILSALCICTVQKAWLASFTRKPEAEAGSESVTKYLPIRYLTSMSYQLRMIRKWVRRGACPCLSVISRSSCQLPAEW